MTTLATASWTKSKTPNYRGSSAGSSRQSIKAKSLSRQEPHERSELDCLGTRRAIQLLPLIYKRAIPWYIEHTEPRLRMRSSKTKHQTLQWLVPWTRPFMYLHTPKEANPLPIAFRSAATVTAIRFKLWNVREVKPQCNSRAPRQSEQGLVLFTLTSLCWLLLHHDICNQLAEGKRSHLHTMRQPPNDVCHRLSANSWNCCCLMWGENSGEIASLSKIS